jgi:hypothetical protein
MDANVFPKAESFLKHTKIGVEITYNLEFKLLALSAP